MARRLAELSGADEMLLRQRTATRWRTTETFDSMARSRLSSFVPRPFSSAEDAENFSKTLIWDRFV
jgi:hypothetical protein